MTPPSVPPRARRSPLIAWALAATAAVLVRLGLYALAARAHGGLATALCQFDCFWYARIGTQGYLSDAGWDNYGAVPNFAFFPLYPLLLGRLAALTGLSGVAAGMVISNLCLVGIAVLGLAYLRQAHVFLPAWIWILFLLAFPNSFFLSAVYTEALFGLLALGCLHCLATSRPHLAALCAGLAAATRPTGILLAPLVAADRLAHLRANWRTTPDRARLLADAALPLALAPLGLALYIAAQYLLTGDGLAFTHVQLLWRREWLGPVEWFRIGLASWDWHRFPREPTHAYEAAWGLAGLAMAAWCARSRRFAEAFFLAGCVLLPAASGLDSLPRYVATNPVFLLALARPLARLPRPWPAAPLIIALAAAQYPLLRAWMSAWGGVF